MPSRQDQLHSYQFSTQRVVAALVMRETDPAQSPFRRVLGAALGGALIAVVALAAVAVYGLLTGTGGKDWRQDGAIIIEKESGARYVYYKGDNKLHPVLNYASALLVPDSAPKTVSMSRRSLEGVPRGLPMGIPGAPDSLPDPKRLLRSPWGVCSRPAADGSGRLQSVLTVGSPITGGRVLSTGSAEGLLVRTPDDQQYLVWENRRYLIREPRKVLTALTWASHPQVDVAHALVNALPAGVDLEPLAIPNRGKTSAKVRGAKIGKVYVSENQSGGRQYAVVADDGLVDITEMQRLLLLDETGQPETLRASEYANLPKSSQDLGRGAGVAALPSTPPKLTTAAGVVCATIPDARGVSEVRVDATVPDSTDTAATPSRTTSGSVLADRIAVPAGRGALVEALSSPDAPRGALSIVTDQGRRYPIASEDLLSRFGYGSTARLKMPAELVALLPVGPALDPAAARTAVTS